MHPKNRAELAHRVAQAAGAALADHGYVSCVDVLIGMGWLDPKLLEEWRRGRVDFLERVVRANLSRISEAMKLFRSWAAERGLLASETAYVRWTKGHRPPLRFSKSGNPHIERSYRTHFVSHRLVAEKSESARKRELPRNELPPSPEFSETLYRDEFDTLPPSPRSTFPPMGRSLDEDDCMNEAGDKLVAHPFEGDDELPF